MKTIQSRTNPAIKQTVCLQQAKFRKKYNQFVAEGITVVSTLIQSGMQPIMLYLIEEHLNTFITQKNITLVTDQVMQKLSAASKASGVVGVFEIPHAPASLDPFALVLAQVADPGNMGTLIRSATAFGKKSVIIIEGCDPWAPKVIQATAGTIASVAIQQMSWDQLIAHKPNLCALVVQDGKAPDQIDLKQYMLVVGSEAHGLPDEWLADCQEKLTLPMPGKTESLNAAVAGSIALYIASNL